MPAPSHALLAFLVLLAGSVLPGAARGADGVGAPPILSFRDLWDLKGDDRARPRTFTADVAILHYDPFWRQLWCQDATGTFFILPPPEPLPIRSGQRVRLTGITIPATASVVQMLSAEVLQEHAAIAPLAAAGRLLRADLLNERLVEVEGLVDRQRLNDPNHLVLSLVSDGLVVEAVLLISSTQPVPQYAGSLVRVRGVYNGRFDSAHRLQSVELGCSGPDPVSVLGPLDRDPRFDRPAVPAEQMPRLAPDALVRVAGRVVAVADGQSVTVRDETGQIELLTPQESGLRLDERAEGIGFPLIDRGRWQLRHAVVRRVGPPVEHERLAGYPVLRLAEQVLSLSPSRAANGEAVRLQGVVTWSAPEARFLFLEDASGGVHVSWSDAGIQPPPPGTGLSVEGFSMMGAFAPAVTAIRFVPRPGMAPPEPRRISLEQAETGNDEARWAEMEGLLREIRTDGAYLRLRLTTPTGDFDAVAPAGTALTAPVGSFVRIRGVCTALANDQRQLTGIQLWVRDAASLVVQEAPPEDLFGLPEIPIAGLRQFGPLQKNTRWLHTAGIVTWHLPGRFLIIQDGDEGLTVFANDETRYAPGDRVEVVGIPGHDGPRLVLRNATVRRIGSAAFVRPIPLDPSAPAEDRLDTRLVRLSGRLDEITDLRGEHFLAVRHSSGSVVARLPIGPPLPRDWRAGAEIEILGVYRSIFDEHRQRTGFEVLLRSAADLQVRRAAPAWTPERARTVVYGLGAAAALVGLWVLALRRKVRQQTAQLRVQLEKEAHLEAELERAQRLQSLGTMAGGIAHDFNNLLTVVMGNVTLAMLDHRVMALAGDCLTEAEAGAQRARDLTQQILTFARGGEPIRETFALPALVHDTVALALSGAKVRAEVHTPPGLWPVHADRAQVHRALHNLLHHALTAMPGGGIISLDFANHGAAEPAPPALAPGRYIRATITDHGAGIPAEQLAAVFDPYANAATGGDRFGLATAYSIAQKHGGLLAVQSRPEFGTTFTLWLPAAPEAPAPAPGFTDLPASALAPINLAGARVLVMDDEEGIRLLAKMLLRHLGCEPVLTADGAECVETFRAAQAAGRPFDLVILDLTVPGGMGGREAMAALRKLTPDVRAIVSSGYSHDPVLARYRDHGFAASVTKPYEVSGLANAIRAVLTGRDGL